MVYASLIYMCLKDISSFWFFFFPVLPYIDYNFLSLLLPFSLCIQMRASVPPMLLPFQLPRPCPLSAAPGPSVPPVLSNTPSPILHPSYLLPTGPFGGVIPASGYPTHWPQVPCPVGTMGPVVMKPLPTLVNPALQAFPMAMNGSQTPRCRGSARTV